MVTAYTCRLEEAQRKEQFSRAYVHAVASTAGFSTYLPLTDRESVDIGFSGEGDEQYFPPRLEAQLKCTSRDVLSDSYCHYPLKIKNYDDLRKRNVMVPRILIVLIVPMEVESWINPSEFKTVLMHSGYWTSIRGEPETPNVEKVTIRIPRINRFTAEGLTELMTQIAKQGRL